MFTTRIHRLTMGALGLAVAATTTLGADALAAPTPTVFSAAGDSPAAIQATVDAFRAALGVLNGNLPPQASGRREINWDGGGAAAPFNLVANPNLIFAGRGNVTLGGAGFTAFSGAPTPEFGNLDAGYPGQFQPFSSPRLFGAPGSLAMDATFNLPGSAATPALTRAFGVIFVDVDEADTSGMELFDEFGASMGTFYAAPFVQGLSFLGLLFDTNEIASARLLLGTTPLGSPEGDEDDVVVVDDFIFGEPAAVPAPAALGLFGLGLAALARRRAAPLG
jgi:hypothetical protein